MRKQPHKNRNFVALRFRMKFLFREKNNPPVPAAEIDHALPFFNFRHTQHFFNRLAIRRNERRAKKSCREKIKKREEEKDSENRDDVN